MNKKFQKNFLINMKSSQIVSLDVLHGSHLLIAIHTLPIKKIDKICDCVHVCTLISPLIYFFVNFWAADRREIHPLPLSTVQK